MSAKKVKKWTLNRRPEKKKKTSSSIITTMTLKSNLWETDTFRPRKLSPYWYTIHTDPKKVLAPGVYKDYHPYTGVNYKRTEVYEPREEMLHCDAMIKQLDACLERNMDQTSKKLMAQECKPMMENFKKSCGMRRYE